MTDTSSRPQQTVAAARELWMRVATGPIFDGPGVDGLAPAARLAGAARFLDDFGDAEYVLPAVPPHGTYSVSPDLLAASFRVAAEAGAIWSTPLRAPSRPT